MSDLQDLRPRSAAAPGSAPSADQQPTTRREAARIASEHSNDPAVALAAMRPFRISSINEMILARKAVLQATGLKLGEFSENAWGFPFLPFPVPQLNGSRETGYHQVPRHINMDYFGHPIFWLDPKISAPTEAEQRDPVRWNIRMFYVLLAAGLLDGNTLRWYNAPRSKGLTYTGMDVENYMAEYPSPLDEVVITEEDFLIPMGQVLEATEAALLEIDGIRRDEAQRVQMLQRQALADAKRMLETNPIDARWQTVRQRAHAVAWNISRSYHENTSRSGFVEEAFAVKDLAIAYLTDMVSTTLTLTIPVVQNLAYTTSMNAKIVSLIGSFKADIIGGGYETAIQSVITTYFEKGGYAEDSDRMTALLRLIDTQHQEATAQLDLALTNFGRNERGEAIYTSATEKDLFNQVEL